MTAHHVVVTGDSVSLRHPGDCDLSCPEGQGVEREQRAAFAPLAAFPAGSYPVRWHEAFVDGEFEAALVVAWDEFEPSPEAPVRMPSRAVTYRVGGRLRSDVL